MDLALILLIFLIGVLLGAIFVWVLVFQPRLNKLNQNLAYEQREKEILSHIAAGLTNNQIAEKLFISIDTVDSHRKNLHAKLNVKNTAMLIRFAIENNLV